jgi:hypothetical protein
MKRITACICIIVVFLSPVLLLGAEKTYVRKDPILAGALSWYVPGLGQLYAGAYLKGAAFWLVEEALLASTILTLAELELNVTGDINLGVNIKSKENPDNKERKTAFILGTSLVIVHFLNVIDAVNTTSKYNQKQEQKIYTDMTYSTENSSYNAGIHYRF